MPRYVAFLRGVSPMNAKMPVLRQCFEDAGFDNVRTVISSGNVVFDTRSAPDTTVARKAERAMETGMDRSFMTIVRRQSALQALLDADPYARFRLAANAKRVVTFLPAPPALTPTLELPITLRDARILAADGAEVFSAYIPSGNAPDFMTLIEKTFGKALTTRTWETVRKCAAA